MSAETPAARRDAGLPQGERWTLRLYIAGTTPRSVAAFARLERLCEDHLPGRYEIQVLDLAAEPQLAAVNQVMALPTVERLWPEPRRRVIGDLSHADRVLQGLAMGVHPLFQRGALDDGQ